jgi:hypothetical protein
MAAMEKKLFKEFKMTSNSKVLHFLLPPSFTTLSLLFFFLLRERKACRMQDEFTRTLREKSL